MFRNRILPKSLRALLSCALLLPCVATGGDPGAAGTEENAWFRPVENPDTLNYLLHLPAGYPDSKATYPLLFFLHGIAQKGDGSPSSLERVSRDGPFRTMRDGLWDPDLPFIVVGPQSTGLQPWWRGEEVRRVLAHIMVTYRVDPHRRYLTGISMGGRGVWWLAKNFSNEFVAVVPVSAWAGDVSHSCEVFRGMGVWAFHGARDGLIGLASGRKPIDALRTCHPALIPPPAITILDSGHGQWQRIYENNHGDEHVGGDGVIYRDIYRWLLSHKHR